MGRRLGDPSDPLLVSVRSGAKFSMPGMMDTVLNLGLNDKSVKGLAASTDDERFAYDSYRRFISMYGRIVLGIDGELFEHPLEAAKHAAGVKSDAELDAAALKALCHDVQADRSRRPPASRSRRTRRSSSAARSRRCSRAGTAPARSPTACASGSATTSAPPSTCRRWCSATATTTRAPASASPATRPPARTSRTATSSSTPRARTSSPASATPKISTRWSKHFPAIHTELLDIFARLERHYRDMCDTEFTIEQGKLWMLQTRVGKRTGAAALRMAVDMTKGTGKGARALEDHARTRRCMRVDRRPPRPGAAPAVRRQRQGDRQGPGGVAGRGRRHGLLHGRRRRRGRRSAARRSSSCATRRAPRTCTA